MVIIIASIATYNIYWACTIYEALQWSFNMLQLIYFLQWSYKEGSIIIWINYFDQGYWASK